MKEQFVQLIRAIHRRGWAPATGGNYSVVLNDEPLRLLMSPSGIDKGSITESQLLVVDHEGNVVEGTGSASAETQLHLAIVRMYGARSVIHTHSIWNTLASLNGDAFLIEGLEMLKALSGNTTHEHMEWVPIIDNSQDMAALSDRLEKVHQEYPLAHGILLRGHGLYTWGRTMEEANRHVEALEFLFEILGRSSAVSNAQSAALAC